MLEKKIRGWVPIHTNQKAELMYECEPGSLIKLTPRVEAINLIDLDTGLLTGMVDVEKAPLMYIATVRISCPEEDLRYRRGTFYILLFLQGEQHVGFRSSYSLKDNVYDARILPHD